MSMTSSSTTRSPSLSPVAPTWAFAQCFLQGSSTFFTSSNFLFKCHAIREDFLSWCGGSCNRSAWKAEAGELLRI